MRRLGALAMLALAACGRLHFDVRDDGGAGGDDARDAAPDDEPANLAFVTSAQLDGKLGGLAGADATCQSIANGIPLSGTFVALLASSTVPLTARTGGARGWMRTDGEPLFDRIGDVFTPRTFNPFDVDEHGTVIAASTAWTGSDNNDVPENTCQDWTTNSAVLGSFGTPDTAGSMMIVDANMSCVTQTSIYCVQIDRNVIVAPRPGPGRIVFQSTPTGVVSVASFDAHCQADATAAGLSGTFLASVATSTTTIASRFTADARAVRRIDGQIVAPDLATLFAGPATYVNQLADGTYVSPFPNYLWDGTTSATAVGLATCADWTDSSNAEGGFAADAANPGITFWDGGASSCDSSIGLLCLEE